MAFKVPLMINDELFIKVIVELGLMVKVIPVGTVIFPTIRTHPFHTVFEFKVPEVIKLFGTLIILILADASCCNASEGNGIS